MQNAKPKSSSGLREMFGMFCLKVFDGKKNAEQDKDNVDYKKLHQSISSFLKISLESDGNLSFIESAREVVYAMAAVADEIFLNMDWIGKKYWEENMMEQIYFGSQIAGEEIFNRINDLITDKEPTALEKAEIYLKALSLGFKGKCRG
ncbi:MAG: DotU family type IV/VI secretion system protein, partial [Holosporaceae bacterium]|nr:DotU family type IV/VI secretion system protein [Holosporaceae bacterium]